MQQLVELGLALGEDEVGLALIRRFPDGRSRSESAQVPELARDGNRLLEQIDQFLKSCDSGVSELDRIALCAGPGGFTRVRVACAVAQGIGMARNIPVAPINSMQAAAVAVWQMEHAWSNSADAGLRPMQVCVLLDARMKALYAATYQIAVSDNPSGLPVVTVLRKPGLLALEDVPGYFVHLPPLPEGAGSDRRISGDGADRYLPLARDSQEAAGQWLGAENVAFCQPAACELALAALAVAQPADWMPASRVAPFYLREKVALNIEEQAALRAANRQARL